MSLEEGIFSGDFADEVAKLDYEARKQRLDKVNKLIGERSKK
jgi:hypothetical protein